jgi:glycosyltransferase involved in cell wall biosynthesis
MLIIWGRQYLRNIVFIHPSFEVVGGAERVALKFMEVAAEKGFAINLVTFNGVGIRNFLRDLSSKTSFRLWECPHLIGRTPSIDKGIIQSLVLYPILKRLKLERSIVVNTKFNETPTLGDVLYIHYPFYFVAAKNPLDKSLIEGPALNKAVSNPIYATYVKASGIVGSRISWSYIRQASKVFFNSIYTYTLFRYYSKEQNDKYGVLNPPIDNVYFEESIQEKEEIIVMRTKGVNPQTVFDIVLKLAKTLSKWNIYIIGFADKSYYEALRRKLDNASNVKIALNIDEKTKRKLLSKATIYVHLTPYEHFGILIGEALASGCKVVVHRFSGIIYDIALEYSQPTIESCINTYSRFHEIPYIIENHIESNGYDPRVCRSLVVQFSENSFKKKAREIIEHII